MKTRLSLPILIVFSVLMIVLLYNTSYAQEDQDREAKEQDAKREKIHSQDDSPLKALQLEREHLRKEKLENLGLVKKEKEEEGNFDEPQKFIEFYNAIRTREGESKPGYKPNYLYTELHKLIDGKGGSFKKTSSSLNWVERGPGNVSGRTRAIWVDPSDNSHNTWFAGSVGGGIWKTTNAGYTWVNKTPDFPNLSTTTIAGCASNPNILYAGTGEGFYNADAINGSGIFKSTDKGETWFPLPLTVNSPYFNDVNRMVVDPNNPDVLVICANTGFFSQYDITGIFKSYDGGIHWYVVRWPETGRIQQVVATPGNFNVLYATEEYLGVLKSTDAGDTWFDSATGFGAVARVEMAVAPSDPNRLYAAADANASELYMSTNAGASWNLVNQVNGDHVDWLNGQGWYDNTIAVNPYDPDIVYYGGIDIHVSKIVPGEDVQSGVTGIDYENTNSFLSFVNWGGPYGGGGIGTGQDFWSFLGNVQGLTGADNATVELRFGPGMHQNAARFINSAGTYVYKNYVDVPFEAWDVTHNKQLSISFRDWSNNGVFDLVTYNSANLGREYLTVHAIPYNAQAPDPSLAVSNGVLYKALYAMWPILATGGTWDANNLPKSTLRIKYENVVSKRREATPVTDGYANYGKPYIHVDQHNITIVPIDASAKLFWMIAGNDGGVAYSKDQGSTWNEALTGGYNTTQFYGVDKAPGIDRYIGGTQDNGTWISPQGVYASKETFYTRPIGGDGFEAVWDAQDQNKVLGSSQYNNIGRTTDGGKTWVSGTNGLGDVGSANGIFITKIAESNSDGDLLFAVGKSGIWRSDDFAASWNLIPLGTDPDWNFNATFGQAVISIADPQVVWTGSYMSNGAGKLFVSTDGGITFNKTASYEQSMGRLTGIDTDPTNPNIAYAIFSYSDAPKILRTDNLGQSWVDITGFENGGPSSKGFPDVATYCVLVMPYNRNIIWAGTEIGLFESTDNGASWHYNDSGLPSVAIWDMKIVDNQVVVATHGRGIWSVDIPELKDYKPRTVVLSPRLNAAVQSPTGSLLINSTLRSEYDSTYVIVNGKTAFKAMHTTAMDSTFEIPVMKSDTVTISLLAYRHGTSYKSMPITTEVFALAEPKYAYENNFNSESADFAGNGFKIALLPGFSSGAIHSLHPYNDNNDYTYTLLQPIKVAENTAVMSYKDIAIVEPGEPNSKYGDSDFWDYVIVEGTKDGVNWVPLIDGYDCRADQRWLDAYNNNTAPDSTMFVDHTINLRDKFKAGDVILIRFRLMADANTHGWGWAIDNLAIQSNVTALANENALPSSFSLSQNYPNPFNPTTTIKFALPKQEAVKLKVYDAIGREVETIVDNTLAAGFYTYNWNAAKYASGVYFYTIKAGDFVETKKLVLLK